MTDYVLGDETRGRLMRASTASIATCLFKRGLRSQIVQGALPVSRKPHNMVGQAFTLRTMPAREDRNPISVFRKEDHPQRVAVERCPSGFVMIIDSRKDARAASAGAILVTRLQVRGVAGVVTDGGFRDAEAIGGLAIPAFHVRPSAPTNLTLHEAIDINVPIGCGDAPVFPSMEEFEAFVWESVRDGHSIIGLYPPTHEDTLQRYETWRAKAKT